MSFIQSLITFPIVELPIVHAKRIVAIDTFFPEEAANKLAEIESYNKHLFRPNTYLHKWWARRSGTTFRYILKQLVPEPSRREYYKPGGLEGIVILDPMLGGGTTLHEAIRLGANVIAFDIDPIPILQAKASLSEVPLEEKKHIYSRFEKEITRSIGKYFKTTCPKCHCNAEIQFTLYGLRRKFDGNEVIVVDSFVLRDEANGKQILLNDFFPSLKFSIADQIWRIIDKTEARLEGINGKHSDVLSIPFTERYIPLVITGHCDSHGMFFKKLDENDFQVIEAARRWIQAKVSFTQHDFKIHGGPKSEDLINRAVKYFYELFFPRQLIYIVNSQKLLRSVPQEHSLWMSLLISTSLEFNSALCGYKGAEKRRPGAIRHVFSHHAYSFPYTALENNPCYSRNTSGTLGNLFESRIDLAGKWARAPIERFHKDDHWKKVTIPNEMDLGEEISSIDDFSGRSRMFLARQNDSREMPLPNRYVDYVVTDPPYFDNVQYSDLSHFFRCWLKTFLPKEANWQYITSSSAVAEFAENEDKFGSILGSIWKECNRVLKRPHGRLIFTYHHWNPNAWAQLTIALKKARFILMNAYVVHSENPASVHIKDIRSLKHDVILVLKPRNSRKENRWQQPNKISDWNSHSFCKSCGKMVGWILESKMSDRNILAKWIDFMKG